MMIETKRLRIRIASQDEMTQMIERETEPELQSAYREMLQGCLDHPEQWEWYAIWIIEGKDGTRLGDLCFKGLAPDGSVEIGYGLLPEARGKGCATEAVDAAVTAPAVTEDRAPAAPETSSWWRKGLLLLSRR